jgi:hypothetical protein
MRLYESQAKRKPTRVVVHKSSFFSSEEKIGIEEAAHGIDYIDLVHVFPTSDVKLFHTGSGFPPLRGTLVHFENRAPAYLYTTGYIPALGTYPGNDAPWPLKFSWDRLDSSIEQVARDIMSLTKLDWNNADFCTSQPVTMSVSHKVGEILAETRARGIEPPNSYSYYM